MSEVKFNYEEQMQIRGECLTLAHNLYKKLKAGDIDLVSLIACEKIITLTIDGMQYLAYLQWCKDNDFFPPQWSMISVFKGSMKDE